MIDFTDLSVCVSLQLNYEDFEPLVEDQEIESVDQSEEGFDNYQQSEVGQYDNMYDGYYEGDESSQTDYSHLDNSLHVGSSKGEY